MGKKNRSDMPEAKRIFRHWQKKLIKHDREIFNERMCFACLREGSVQRCHIHAFAKGGNNKVENLHLLCPNCHSESEGYSGEFYWIWFSSKDLVFLPLYRNIERANLSFKFAEFIKKEYSKDYFDAAKTGNPEDLFQLYLKVVSQSDIGEITNLEQKTLFKNLK